MKPHLTLKTCIVSSALVFWLLPQRATAQGNLVVNGSFDTNASGWVITNTSGFGYQSILGNPGGFVLLDNIAPSPSTDPTASQTINGLIPGAIYSISGDYEKQKDRGATVTPSTDNSFGVAMDGVFLFEAASSTNLDLTWYSFNFLYTASSSSVLLSLSSQINGTGVSYGIDNISMIAVPEPTETALIFLGSGVFIYVRTRNQRHSAPAKPD